MVNTRIEGQYTLQTSTDFSTVSVLSDRINKISE